MINAMLALLQPWATLPARYWHTDKQSFGYTANFTGNDVATASATTTVNVQVNNDSDFFLTLLAGTFFNTDDTTILNNPPFLVQLTEASSGRAMFDRPSPVMAVLAAVNGVRTGVDQVSKGYLLTGGTTFAVALTNLGATNRNVRLTLHGIKLYSRAE